MHLRSHLLQDSYHVHKRITLNVPPKRRIIVDSRDPRIEGGTIVSKIDYNKFCKHIYPDDNKELEQIVPNPTIEEVEIISFVYSGHGHDRVT